MFRMIILRIRFFFKYTLKDFFNYFRNIPRYRNLHRRMEIGCQLLDFEEKYLSSFEEIYALWYEFFEKSMRAMGIRSRQASKLLFEEWEMENWKNMHLENSVYAEYNRDRLYQSFSGDVNYISDRISFDRLFRAHWFFRQVFMDELTMKYYPFVVADFANGILKPYWSIDGTRRTESEKTS